jgi:hypothetical protein
MKISQTDLGAIARSPRRGNRRFLGGSDARVTLRLDEVALIRGNAKLRTAQALLLRPIRGKSSRATSQRQRHTAAKLTALMTGIRSFMKAYAILWQKLYARFSEHTFDQSNRVLVSQVVTHLDIRDRVSMKIGRLSQVPEPSDSAQHAPSQAQSCASVTCDKVAAVITMSPKQWGIQ